MIDPYAIDSVPAAFVAGLLTSAHCVGMCGPLACILAPAKDEGTSMQTITAAYNCSRVLAISLVGAVLGALGKPFLDAVSASPVLYLPWLLAVFFLLIALGADKWLPRPRALSRLFFRAGARLRKLPRLSAGILIGLLTPLLPCGPLYLMFGLALLTGDAVRGAEFLFAFGLGTVPLLFFVQGSWARWRHRLSPVWMNRLQRGMALIMAVFIVLRLTSMQGAAPQPAACPLCP